MNKKKLTYLGLVGVSALALGTAPAVSAVASSANVCATQLQKVANLGSSKADKQKEADSLSSQLAAAKENYKKVSAQSDAKIKAAKDAIAAKQKAVDAAQKKLDAAKADYKQKNDAFAAEKDKQAATIANAKQVNKLAQQQLDDQQQKVDQAAQKVQNAKSNLQAKKDALAAERDKQAPVIADAKKLAKGAQDQLDAQQQQVNQFKQELILAQNALTQNQAALETAGQNYTSAANASTEADSKVNTAQADFEKAQDNVISASNTVTTVSNAQKSRLNELNQSDAKATADIEQANEVLKNKQDALAQARQQEKAEDAAVTQAQNDRDAKLPELQKKLDEDAGTVKQWEGTVQGKIDSLAAAQKELNRAESVWDQVQKTLTVMQNHGQSAPDWFMGVMQNAYNKYSEAKTNHSNAMTALNDANTEIKKARQNLAGSQAAFDEVESGQAIKDAQSKVNATRDQIDKLSDAVSAEQSNNKSITDKANNVLAQNAAEKAALAQQVKNANGNFDNAKLNFGKAKDAVDSASGTAKDLKGKADAAKEQVGKAQSAADSSKDALSKAHQNLDVSQAEMDQLTQSLKDIFDFAEKQEETAQDAISAKAKDVDVAQKALDDGNVVLGAEQAKMNELVNTLKPSMDAANKQLEAAEDAVTAKQDAAGAAQKAVDAAQADADKANTDLTNEQAAQKPVVDQANKDSQDANNQVDSLAAKYAAAKDWLDGYDAGEKDAQAGNAKADLTGKSAAFVEGYNSGFASVSKDNQKPDNNGSNNNGSNNNGANNNGQSNSSNNGANNGGLTPVNNNGAANANNNKQTKDPNQKAANANKNNLPQTGENANEAQSLTVAGALLAGMTFLFGSFAYKSKH